MELDLYMEAAPDLVMLSASRIEAAAPSFCFIYTQHPSLDRGNSGCTVWGEQSKQIIVTNRLQLKDLL